MCKKGLSVLVLLSLWMCLTGFASLGEEGKDTWNSMMEQLSAEEIDQLLAEENEWYGKVMANVEDSVTIRAEASTDSAAVGKMFKGDAGEILEQQEGWTRIQSGDVDGWVSDEYLAFGKDAEERAEEDVKKFFINEIRLYNETESAPILAKQLNARSVEIRGEAIKTLGKLKYKEVEPKLIEMYNVQPEEVKRQIISAIADLKTDKALGFLYNAYDEADTQGTKRVILKALYEYSAMGRKTFDQLERKADSHTAILFAHTKHPLINQLN